jgi:hypothetical protein
MIMNLVNQKHNTTGRHRALFLRTVRRAVVLSLAIFAVLAVGAAPVQAAPISLVNLHTNRCLADSFANGLEVLPCRFPDSSQNWEDVHLASGTYVWRNAHTRRCLADSFASGLQVISHCGTATLPLHWVDISSDYRYRFYNQHTHRCLEDSFASRLQSIPCSPAGPGQYWH